MRQQCMEVGVQCDDSPTLCGCQLENFCIFSSGQSNFTGVDSVNTSLPQQGRCCAWKTLVKQ